MTSRQFNQSSLALSRCLANGRFRVTFPFTMTSAKVGSPPY
jgi:hypothetical protein